jgi:hypothetical protein
MANLGFTFEARFFAPVQPEDCPALDAATLAPPRPSVPAPLHNGAQQAAESVESSLGASEYEEWKAICKTLSDREDSMRERFYDIQRRAREEIKILEDTMRDAKLEWQMARDTPRPPVPKSKRRR